MNSSHFSDDCLVRLRFQNNANNFMQYNETKSDGIIIQLTW